MIRKLIGAAVLVGALAFAGEASAGSIYLTGHDVDLHSGQNSYDNVILDYLRGDGTVSEIAAGSYDIVVLRGFVGFIGTVGVNTYEGFGTITEVDIATLVDDATLTAALAGKDVVAISSHTSCGGCDIDDSDVTILNARSGAFTSFFNDGGDIYGNSGASNLAYYGFLPPTAVASGLPIGGSSGFTCTAAGNAIGITGTGCTNPGSNMINGFPTHNRFTAISPVFTVFEVRDTEIISIGVRDARIVDDIVTDDTTDGDGTVPEPASLALLGLGLAGAAAARRRRAKA